jgi:ribose/xylose/arabinose/galactoside ABC-type transport system permease subunit
MIDYAIPQTPPPARSPLIWPLAGLGLLLVINVIINPAFLKITILDGHLYGLPIDILNQGSRSMLLALGMTLVIATGGVDLAVGSLMAVAGAVTSTLLMQHGSSLPVAIGAGVSVTAFGGLLSGLMVSWLGLQPIVATLILMIAGRGVAQKITGGEVIVVQNSTFEFLGNGFVLGLPFSILLVGVFYLLAQLFLRRTAAGLFIEAVGDNEKAARFAGLAAARVKALVYVFSGVCAGVAGLLATSNIRAADPYRAGEMMELDAIFAVVVGGTALTGGRFVVAGAFVGALLLQTLTTTMYVVGVRPDVAPVPKAILIIIVCLFQSDKTRAWLRGLFKRRAA